MYKLNSVKFSFLLVFVGLSSSVISQQDSAIYKTIGGMMEDRFETVIYTPDSNLVSAGMTSSINGFNQWAFLCKTDSLLEIEWTKVYGLEGNASFTDVCLTEDDGYLCVGFNLTGSNSYDGLAVKFNADGEMIWDKSFGGANWDFFNSVVLTSNGYVIAGKTNTNTSGGSDGWLVKLDFNGNIVWERTLGNETNETLNSVDEFLSGHLVVGGSRESADYSQMWIARLDADGNLLHENFHGDTFENSANSVLADPFTEDYYFGGSIFNTELDNTDAIAGALDSAGTVIWMDTLNALGEQSYNSLEFGKFFELIACGSSEGADFGLPQNDLLIKRLVRQNGIFIYQGSYGSEGNDEGMSSIRIHNAYVLAGKTNGQGAGQDDAYLIRTRENGSVENFSLIEDGIESLDNLVNVSNLESKTYTISASRLLVFKNQKVKIFDTTGRLLKYFENNREIDLNQFTDLIIIKIEGEHGFVFCSLSH